jgi:hypothetical protein
MQRLNRLIWFFAILSATSSILTGCNFPAPVKIATRTIPAPTNTVATAAIIQPTYTPLPTYTMLPTYTPATTDTPILLYTAAITLPPTPSPLPGFEIRIRNMTGGDVNLYRHGRSGEMHFLGWLVHGYYGIFRFPGYGEWLIRYCVRVSEKVEANCNDKRINFEKENQEFKVP